MKKKDLTYYQAQRKYNLPRLGDYDKDGVLNMWDCKPFDPNRDGFFGRALNVLSVGKYGQSKEDYEKEKIAKEQSKLDKEKESMPHKPVYGPEDEYHPEKVEEKPKKSTEPYVLYIKYGLTEPYTLVGQFESSWEASKYFDENYKGFPHKIMSVSDAQEEERRLEESSKRRKEMITEPVKKVVAGAKAFGKGVNKAVEKVEELEKKRQVYLDKLAQRQLAQEERELKRLQLAREKEVLRYEQEQIKDNLRERERIREAERQKRSEKESKFYAPTKQFRGLNQPSSPRFTIVAPSPTMRQPWGVSEKARPTLKPINQHTTSFTIASPIDIRWKPPVRVQPVVKKSKYVKRKSHKTKRKK